MACVAASDSDFSLVIGRALFNATLPVVLLAFTSLARILWESLTIHSPAALSVFLVMFRFVLFCFSMEISSRTPIPLFFFFFCQDRSTMAQRAVRRLRPSVSLRVACELVFPDRFLHYA